MFDKIKSLCYKYRQILLYVIFGGLTTLINIGVYYISSNIIRIGNIQANIIAWIASVLFAYISNKIWVFNSKTDTPRAFFCEIGSFFSCRLFTGVIDLSFMLLTVDFFRLNTPLLSTSMKVISNLIVIILNYVLSKIYIFNNRESTKTKNVYSYLILLLFSAISCYVFLFKGLSVSDGYTDAYFHYGQIYDLYNSAKEGNYFACYNHYTLSFLGYNVRLFYSPLSHISVVFTALLFESYGMSLIVAYKITVLVNVFLGSVFMYNLVMKMAKGNRVASAISGICFIFFPYRFVDIFTRHALAEGMALSFVPLIFMGAYDLVHMKEFRIVPFVEIIAGVSLTVLNHNITGFFSCIFALIYVLVNAKEFFPHFRKIKFAGFLILAVILTTMICLPYLSGLYDGLTSGYFIVQDSELMGISRIEIFKKSGGSLWALGMLYFDEFNSSFREGILKVVQVVLLISSFVSMILVDRKYLIHKKKAERVLIITLFFVLNFLILHFSFQAFVAEIIYLLLTFSFKTEEEKEHGYYLDDKEIKIIFVTFFVTLVLIYFGYIWFALPKIFTNIQFTWRLYIFADLCLSVLVGLTINHFGLTKTVKNAAVIMITSFVLFSQPFCSENQRYYEYLADKSIETWTEEIDKGFAESNENGSAGWQKEYTPCIFHYDDYISEYPGSLYNRVKEYIHLDRFDIDNYTYIEPAVLSGNGELTVTERNVPHLTLKVNAENRILVQVPQIYYKGYTVSVTDSDGNESKIEAEETDGLLSFELSAGNYTVNISYTGTAFYNVSKYIGYIGIGITAVLLCIGVFIDAKSKKKEETAEA